MFPSFIEMPFTYIICILVMVTSIIGFYFKPFYQFFIYHPYIVFKGKRIHTIFTSAFVHKNWWHLFFNLYVFYSVMRDVECIILEISHAIIIIKLICLLLVSSGILLPNLILGWFCRNKIQKSFVGFSGAGFCSMGFSILFLPLDHPKEHYKYIPLYFSYEFAISLFIVCGLLATIFIKSSNNHKGHLIRLVAGFILAIAIRPGLILEIVNHIKFRIN